MTRDEAVSMIKENLGFRTDTVRDAAIVARLQQAQRLLERGRSLPKFLLVEDATIVAPTGGSEVAFPDRFLREREGETFHFTPVGEDTPSFLEKMSLEEIVARFDGADAGAPVAYTVRQGTFKFAPERDQDYTLTYSYYRGAEILTADIENAWLANSPDVLVGAAGILVAKALRDEAAEVLFRDLLSVAWAGMFAHDILQEEENDPLFMGGRL